MKKTLIYTGILLGLTLFTLGTYLHKEKTSLPEKEKAFTVENISELSKIHLKNRLGDSIVLVKKGEQWLLDGKEKVEGSLLKNLLNALENMYADTPVPAVAQNNVLKEMVERATEVNLYKQGETNPYKSFYVGGANHNQDGTYMLMKINGTAASTAYVVKLPGFRGFLTYRFLPQRAAWQSLEFVNYMPNEIKSVTLQYFNENAHESFKIERKGNGFELYTHNGTTIKDKQINQVTANNLFASFHHLSFEKAMNDYAKQDSVKQHLTFLNLEIKTIYGDTKKLEIYYMPAENENERRLKRPDGSYTQFNADRLFAYNQESNSFVSIQFATFGGIFLKENQLIK